MHSRRRHRAARRTESLKSLGIALGRFDGRFYIADGQCFIIFIDGQRNHRRQNVGMGAEGFVGSASETIVVYGVENESIGVVAVARNNVATVDAGATGGGAKGRHEVVNGDGVEGVGIAHIAPAAGTGESAVAPAADAEIEVFLEEIGADYLKESAVGSEDDIASFAVALLLRYDILRGGKVVHRLIPWSPAFSGGTVGVSLMDIALESAGTKRRVEAKLEAKLGRERKLFPGTT